jgi:hypothetical protein
LLVVLLSKQGHLRLDDVEEFEDDGCDAAEVAWAEFTIKLPLNLRRIDVVLLRLRVEVSLRGSKQQVDTGRGELVAIGLKRAWIAVEIVSRSELETIHENACHDGVAVSASVGHQGNVAGMQIAHGRHKSDTTALLPDRCAEFVD